MATASLFYTPRRTLLGKLGRVNWVLVLLLCLLTGVGIVALYSVAGGAWSPWAERHAVRFLAGLGLLLCISLVPLRAWLGLALPVYLLALVLLVLVPLVGSEALGARRWLALGGVSFQPAELMKVALIAVLAAYYQAIGPTRVSRPAWVAAPLIAIALPVALTAKQPDLGTSALLAMTGLGVMLLAGVNLVYFALAGLAAVAAMPFAIGALHDYQRRRLEIFLDPGRDPLGAGYHITQSKIALGSGGISGKGFLSGTQSQLDFLPEKHTDFIFTTIAEEWGFVGALVLLVLFGALLAVLLRMSLGVVSTFGRLIVSGVLVVIFGYVTINVGMVTGLVPVVGVPLPFISYGGTSMLTLMGALGLAMCAWVHRGERLDPSRPAFRASPAD